MALDPKTQAVLDKMLASGTSNWDDMTPTQVRETFGGAGGDVAPEVFKVEDRHIPDPPATYRYGSIHPEKVARSQR